MEACDGDSEGRGGEGERLTLDLDVIHDQGYREGYGPTLYAVYDGGDPGLYDKYVVNLPQALRDAAAFEQRRDRPCQEMG